MSTLRARPRLRRRSLPAALLLVALLGFLAPHRGWLLLLLGLSALWALGYLWARSLARGLRLERRLRHGWSQVGDTLLERFTLHNDGWAPALWLELEDHASLPGYPRGRLTRVGAFDHPSWHQQARCTRRGLYTLGPTTLRTGDPFGLYDVELHDPQVQTLLVLPPILPLPALDLATSGWVAGNGRGARPAEAAVSASGVREYLPGDSLRHVHWRTTARRDRWYIRQLETAPAGDLWLVLDLEAGNQVGEPPESSDEFAVLLAASLADRELRRGRRVGLLFADEGGEVQWLAPRQGEEQRFQILRTLALAGRSPLPLAAVLASARGLGSGRSGWAVITLAREGAWLAPLAALPGAVTALLIDPRPYGASASPAPLLRRLHGLGVQPTLLRPEGLPSTYARREPLPHGDDHERAKPRP